MFRLSLAVLLGALAVYGAPAQTPSCARFYDVQSGDTCNSICAAQHVSTFQLSYVNPQINAGCTNIFPTEPLCLGISGQDCSTVHVVQSGDICATIASNAGISLSTLLANNPNVNSGCTNIAVGEVLCTGSQVINYD